MFYHDGLEWRAIRPGMCKICHELRNPRPIHMSLPDHMRYRGSLAGYNIPAGGASHTTPACHKLIPVINEAAWDEEDVSFPLRHA
jgi:hypothetical protein